MSIASNLLQELSPLLEALCEERLTGNDFTRFERLLAENSEARAYYVEYMELHASLHWDTALSSHVTDDPVTELVDATILRLAEPELVPATIQSEHLRPSRQAAAWVRPSLVAAAACIVLAVGVWIGNRTAGKQQIAHTTHQGETGHSKASANDKTARNSDGERKPSHNYNSEGLKLTSVPSDQAVPPVATETPADSTPAIDNPAVAADLTDKNSSDNVQKAVADNNAASSATVVSYVNDQLKNGWTQAGITASPRADDAEWLRRIHLDLVGHIPDVEQVEKFLADRSPRKRGAEVDRLLDSPDFGRHFATIWTNLLIGRINRPEVNRGALARFLRQSFQHNRPWSEVVYDLVAAEGRTDQNGAANFLVAHLNNGAIPATGIISRLFLGSQLQCAQCHNHPTDDTKQEQFWAFNSFFQQAVVVREEKYDPKTGRVIVAGIELATKATEGPVFYETRKGLMKVAFPQFGSTKVEPGKTSRRRELAKLMQTEGAGLAPAFVNRMWAHFHGRAFTPVVDDLGSHSHPSHPELLDRLSLEFKLSGYDVKQLVRWICNSDSYQLTSRFNDSNAKDDPETGEPPLFSRAYVRQMSAEQLYDSLVVATQGQLAGGPTLAQSDTNRDNWLKQFSVSYQTEENDEISILNGTITQSLLMMNGELVRDATSMQTGTWLHKMLAAKHNETDRIQALFEAALSRHATAKELTAVKRLVKNGAKQTNLVTAYQDVYWALLNSNEFILNH